MKASTLRNVARNAFRPHYLPIMARKAAARLRPSREDSIRYASEHVERLADFRDCRSDRAVGAGGS